MDNRKSVPCIGCASRVTNTNIDIIPETTERLTICDLCGGLEIQFDSPEFVLSAKGVAEILLVFSQVDNLPPLPPIVQLRTIKAFVAAITQHVAHYGAQADENCVAKRIKNGELDEILTLLKNICAVSRTRIEESPENPDPATRVTRNALIAMFQGDFDETDRLFREGLTKYISSSVLAHDYATFLLNFRRDPLSAIIWFEHATTLEPKKAMHFLKTVGCLQLIDRFKDCAKYIAGARLCPDYGRVSSRLKTYVDLIVTSNN